MSHEESERVYAFDLNVDIHADSEREAYAKAEDLAARLEEAWGVSVGVTLREVVSGRPRRP